MRISVEGGVNLSGNNSSYKVKFTSGQILLFKKTGANEITFYPPLEKKHRLSNIDIYDDNGNVHHIKILINDPLTFSASRDLSDNDLVKAKLKINGGVSPIYLDSNNKSPNLKKLIIEITC